MSLLLLPSMIMMRAADPPATETAAETAPPSPPTPPAVPAAAAAAAAPPPPPTAAAALPHPGHVWDQHTFTAAWPAGTTLTRCVFQRCTFDAALHDLTFHACTFADCRFAEAVADTTFHKTTFHRTQWHRRITDTTWTRCTFTHCTGPWHALRCTVRACAWAATTWTRHAQWNECTLDGNTRFVESTLDTTTWTDTVARDVTFERCSLQRTVWRHTQGRHVAFVACVLHNATWANNRWYACAWTRTKGTHTHHVAERHVRTRCVQCQWPQAVVSGTTYVRDVQDDTVYTRSQWSRCTFAGSTWRRVRVDQAAFDTTAFTNVTHLDIGTENATYCNVVRRTSPAVDVTVHRRKVVPQADADADADADAAAALTVSVVLYGDKLPLGDSTVLTLAPGAWTASFRISATTAKEVDFVYARPVAPWYTFGLSTPTDTHQTVSHVTVGPLVLCADRASPYTSLAGGPDTPTSLVGYRRRRMARSHSR